MQARRVVNPRSNRLRFVFGSKVVSFRLSPEATFEDVAVRFGRLATKHAETPVGIAVTFATKPPLTQRPQIIHSTAHLIELPVCNNHPPDASFVKISAFSGSMGDRL